MRIVYVEGEGGCDVRDNNSAGRFFVAAGQKAGGP